MRGREESPEFEAFLPADPGSTSAVILFFSLTASGKRKQRASLGIPRNEKGREKEQRRKAKRTGKKEEKKAERRVKRIEKKEEKKAERRVKRIEKKEEKKRRGG